MPALLNLLSDRALLRRFAQWSADEKRLRPVGGDAYDDACAKAHRAYLVLVSRGVPVCVQCAHVAPPHTAHDCPHRLIVELGL